MGCAGRCIGEAKLAALPLFMTPGDVVGLVARSDDGRDLAALSVQVQSRAFDLIGLSFGEGVRVLTRRPQTCAQTILELGDRLQIWPILTIEN